MKKQQKKPNNELTPKVLRFGREYVIDHNGKQAAIRAGYAARTAEQQASRLLSNVKVKEFISSLESEVNTKLEQKHELSKDRVLQELARIGLFDARKLFTVDGAIKAPCHWEDDVAAVIVGLDVHEDYVSDSNEKEATGAMKKVKLADKLRALEIIGKMLGYYSPDKTPGEANTPSVVFAGDLSKLDEKELRAMAAIQKKLNA
ncbi:terminase small subunit [Chitinophaga sp. sic0106]|uniref:terminase small subunit n=1 Tax=Chitinophaga sp. sic0106 TaxID=2854785 RepID=UPI001C450279|nr:terminase small subunit [Chitinophaga sp. sic0106]MBV7531335.1 terminase small subunit [Chitinophaga sp. sic0106]